MNRIISENQHQLSFSLILATFDRTTELSNFLFHLNHQEQRTFELIVVDQNLDDRLIPILSPYKKRFPLKHIYSEVGLSKARNVGIKNSVGDIITFPDDDCWYPKDLFAKISSYFAAESKIGGVAGLISDENDILYPGFSKQASYVTKFNVWGRSSSIGVFLKRAVIEKIGGFDESLGVGSRSKWKSSEDIDYMLRIIDGGFQIYYDPEIIVFHPNPVIDGYKILNERAYGYGLGMGHVWRKHHFPLWYVAYRLSRSFGGSIISIAHANFSKARYQWLSFRGKWDGWWDK